MDYGSSYYVSQEDFILFHKMDRDLYRILVINLSRDPTESMQILAMWLWLEKVGFLNLVKKIITLPIILISEVADETLTCLNVVSNSGIAILPPSPPSSEGNDIPLLQTIMDKEISLQFFFQKRAEAVHGVAKVAQEVCLRALSDIMQPTMLRNTAERMVAENSFWFGSIGPSNYQRLGATANQLVLRQQNINHALVPVPADDRTLFVTFSKGYRVEEWEVREFFSMAYGDCIEALYMQEVQPNEQPLFARIVFHKVATIDMILRGASKAKFTINGKHVWARKFVPKRPASSSFKSATFQSSTPNFSAEGSGSAGF